MAGKSSGEQTEAPTPKRLRDAREEGQVAQSRNLTTCFAIISIVLYFIIGRNRVSVLLEQSHSFVFSLLQDREIQNITLYRALSITLNTGLELVLLPIVIASAVSTAICLFQIDGFMISTKAFMRLNFGSLNPLSNIKSLFSKKTLVKFIANNFQICVLTLVGLYLVHSWVTDILLITTYSLGNIIAYLLYLVVKLLIVLLSISCCFALVDFLTEKIALLHQLKMSKEDIKEEYKNTEGNQEVKSERRRLHEEILEGDNAMNAMSQGTFVLANPTHLVLVIQYTPKTALRPKLLLKANLDKALLILSIAKRIGLPIIQDKPLARLMYDLVNVGEFLPNRFLQPVADIIAKNIKLFPKVLLELQEKFNNKAATSEKVTTVGPGKVNKI